MGESQPALGLARTEAVVRPYDERWADAYEKEEPRLAAILGPSAAGIEHIGSTAVPGLAAKPVLDIAIAFRDRTSLDDAVGPLSENGYEWLIDAGAAGGVIVVSGPESAQTHCLHLVESDDPQWQRWVVFRDALREDEALRDRYAELKRQLAARFPNDREAYVNGKEGFIRETLRSRSSL